MSPVESEFSNDPKTKPILVLPEEEDEIQTHGKLKAVEDSLFQLEVENEDDDEGEVDDDVDDDDIDDDEEEGEADYQAEDHAEEEFELCDVCLKDKEHWSFECPYLVRIPNPTEVTIGTGYYVVCADCSELGGHSENSHPECYWWGGNPGKMWEGRALMKVCSICQDVLHWAEECPKKDILKLKSLSECTAEYHSWLATKKCQAA